MFTRSMLDLSAICASHGIPLLVHFLFNESLITRARNYCVDEFMRSGATHLMFIDSDIGFDPRDVIAMMAMQTESSPYDIIGGPYPKKTISWEKIKLAVDKGFADEDPQVLGRFVGDFVFNPKMNTTGRIPLNQPVEVLEIGTGFMMIKRRTLEIFAKSFEKYLYRPDHIRTQHFDGSRMITQFFQAEIDDIDWAEMYKHGIRKIMSNNTDINIIKEEIEKLEIELNELSNKKSKRYLSEDYWFCQKIQELGLKTWLCPWMKTTHSGSYNFDGSLVDLAAIGAPATADPDMLGKNKK